MLCHLSRLPLPIVAPSKSIRVARLQSEDVRKMVFELRNFLQKIDPKLPSKYCQVGLILASSPNPKCVCVFAQTFFEPKVFWPIMLNYVKSCSSS